LTKLADLWGEAWIGVDLDGTLAQYDEWEGPGHIGEVIEPMAVRVRAWMAAGRRVKIMTARASTEMNIPPVQEWLIKHGFVWEDGLPLEITNMKDYQMIQLWDDRAVEVIHNTGQTLKEHIMEQLADGDIPEEMK
jgi:hypothetical protein